MKTYSGRTVRERVMTRLLQNIARHVDDWPGARPRTRFLNGALLGSLFAVFTPVFLLMWALEGPEVLTRRGTIRVDLLALAYPLGAVVSISLLLGLAGVAQSRVGRALLGALAFLPWCGAMTLCLDRGYADWQPVHSLATILCATAIGAPIGWSMTAPRGRRSRS
jgi:hypothetical protein